MTAPILTAEGLTRHYPVKDGMFAPMQLVRALTDVSFELSPGKTLAVVGESGCGKSTLARLITLIEPATSGHFEIEGTKAIPENWADLRTSVQIVFQDPYGSLNPRQRIGASTSRSRSTAPTSPPPTAPPRPARCSSSSACAPSISTATRTCSPAASASASRSPAR